VLLIEPSPESKAYLAELFDQSVWSVSYADDNETAMELAKTETFDLILTNAATTCAEDVVVLQRLRMVRPHTRVIILTKEWLPGDILNAIRNHAFSYFSMPIAMEDLRDLIKYALEQPVWDDGIEMIQGNMEYVVLAVRCDLGTVERLTQFMRESMALPEVECEEVAFAFREIMLNAVEHGGKFDPGQFVEICFLKAKRMVMCRVKDPGEGFSLKEIRDAEIAEPLANRAQQVQAGEAMEIPPRGLGILMARKFVDELIFSEKGNEAFLIKYLPKQSETSSGRSLVSD
jgi:anti-sigma regulatory factor (Ser/Thr protein kinase)